MAENYESYSQVKDRLDLIVDKVGDENISLDEALDLYDEAVKLAMRASDLIEIDIESKDGVESEDEVETQAESGAELQSDTKAKSGVNIEQEDKATPSVASESESKPANRKTKDD